jgi:hypothetical protein
VIVQYLLGSLSEEETERLDELGIVDNEFAARLQLVENDLVDAYARGDLSGETLARFTSFYLSSSKRREKVRFAQVFQTAPDGDLVTAQVESGQRKGSAYSLADERVSRPGWLRGFFSTGRPALVWGVASIALLLAVVGLVVQNRRLQNEVGQAESERASTQQRERELQADLDAQRSAASDKEREMEGLRDKLARLDQPGSPGSSSGQSSSAPEHLMVVPVDLAPQTRSISRLTTVSVPAAADLVTMQLELESGDQPVYRAELKALPGGQIVWSSGRLRPRAKDGGSAVVVNLPPRLLKSQKYVIEVSGISASGSAEIVGSYPFEVKKK